MPSTAFALTVGTLTFFVAVLLGPPLIRGLRLWTIGETTLHVPADDSGSAGDRRFVPIMGGLMVIIPVAVVIITLNVVGLFDPDLTGRSILLPVLVMLTFGAIGMLDDWETMRSIRVEALSARQRLGMQFVLAIATALVLYFLFDIRSLVLPGVEQRIDLGLRYIPVAVVIVFAMSNAMDLTDGVDGLAGIVSVTGFASYGIVALVQEQVFLTQFCMTMVGALVGFLWFNIYPAQLRLGDTGSFALGATLGVVALMTGQWLILPFIAIIPIVEALSVLAQAIVGWLSVVVTGQSVRLLRATPLHHHFEVIGWSQVQIFQRFWVVQLLAATVGVALALL